MSESVLSLDYICETNNVERNASSSLQDSSEEAGQPLLKEYCPDRSVHTLYAEHRPDEIEEFQVQHSQMRILKCLACPRPSISINSSPPCSCIFGAEMARTAPS